MSANVYVVLEVIDLGDRIVSVHYNKSIADDIAKKMNEEYNLMYPGLKQWFSVEQHTIQP